MSISKIFISLCVFSQIKDRKHIEHNFHSQTVVVVMPQGWDLGVLGVKNFSVGIWDGIPSTARSSLQICIASDKLHISSMSRQHPWQHAMDNRILISITVSETRDYCQNLLDGPRNFRF